jgi:hypothetical protein
MPPEAAELETEIEPDEIDAEEIEAADDADETADPEGDEDGETKPKPKAKDPEAQLHNLKGQNARERSRRRAAETRARELEERINNLEKRGSGGDQADRDELLEIIGSLRDDEEDPVGDIAAVKKALKAFRQRQLADTEQSGRQQALERQIQTLQDTMRESESDFVQDFPDYHKAATFYREQRVAELEDAGYSGQALQRKLSDDLFGVVRMAIEAGHDPAERVYALAKRRGFNAAPTAADKKVDVLKRAAEAGRKPGAGGSATPQVMSWADVSKLDGAARDKAWAKLRERERRGR